MHTTRKTITLPSGATVVIRKMKGSDFIELGEAPASLADAPERARDSKPTAKELEWMAGSNRVILSRCTGPVCFQNGTRRRIVDRPFAETGESELSIEEMDDADAAAIITAVSEFTQCGREAARKAQPFPAEQALAAGPASDGEVLSHVADHAPGTEP